MMKPRRLWTFVWLASAAFSSASDESPAPVPNVEIHGPNARPGFPDAFAFGYKLANDSISPDDKYGVIYADSTLIVDEVMRNFLVALKPFRILALADAYNYYNREGMTVEWTKDSSAVFVQVEGKWGPLGFTLFEMRDGRVTRQTNLYAEIVRLLEPGYQKAKVEPWNDLKHFNFDRGEKSEGEGAHLESDGRRIRFSVDATNNPKPMSPPIKTWHGHFEGTWSIPEARWVTHKVTNSTGRQ
ncbi:MAG: hypothetical protein WA849_02515 [Candidatus Udaeobacter sp.]